MENVTALDIAIILLYLLVMLGIGLRYYKRVRNTEDFYTADRSLSGKVLLATDRKSVV